MRSCVEVVAAGALLLAPTAGAAPSERGKPRAPEALAAMQAAAGGDYERAIALYTEALKRDPKDPDLYRGRAQSRRNAGDSEGAVADAGMAVRLEPESAAAYTQRAQARAIAGDLAGARRDYRQAAALYGRRIAQGAGSYQDHSGRGWVRYNLGDITGAARDFARSLELEPAHALAYIGMACVLEARGRSREAVSFLNKAISLAPSEVADAYLERAAVRRSLGDLKGALADLQRVGRLTPGFAEAYRKSAEIRHALEDFRGMAEDCSRGIALNPRQAEFFQFRAYARYRQGDAAGALNDLESAIRIRPRDDFNYVLRAVVLGRGGEAHAALADVDRALALPGDAPRERRLKQRLRSLLLEQLSMTAEGGPAVVLAAEGSQRVLRSAADLPGAYGALERELFRDVPSGRAL